MAKNNNEPENDEIDAEAGDYLELNIDLDLPALDHKAKTMDLSALEAAINGVTNTVVEQQEKAEKAAQSLNDDLPENEDEVAEDPIPETEEEQESIETEDTGSTKIFDLNALKEIQGKDKENNPEETLEEKEAEADKTLDTDGKDAAAEGSEKEPSQQKKYPVPKKKPVKKKKKKLSAKQRRAKEREAKKKALKIISIAVLVLSLLLVFILATLLRARINAEKNTVASESVKSFSISYAGEKTVFEPLVTSSEETAQQKQELTFDTSGLYSPNACMMRLSDNKVILDMNSTQRIYPASMTKIMTTLVAIEHITNLEDTVTFTGGEYDRAYTEGATTANFMAGDVVSYNDVLYGIMLPSGADACYAIADAIGGSESGFVNMMNEKAQQLGMTDTHFTNCTGLTNEEHYTTCADMIKLLQAALQNETFKTVFCTHVHTTGPLGLNPDGLQLSSTAFTYLGSPLLRNGTEITGAKTGFTDEAGHCLASSAKAGDGTEYILVTAGANTEDDPNPHLADAKYLYGQLPSYDD
uniref:D-alanyl-D-alanine carboxypeptidase family protein n=1 Tax=Eubacterium cellulosolvens TaxID=29322 RepID=UPI000687FA70|nr:serine hydrolase [[Eubacterium] cellulosolvens]